MMTPDAAAFAVLAHKVEAMHEDLSGTRADVKQLADAFAKLVLIEERQGHAAAAQERMFAVIEKLERRVAALEARAPETDRIGRWVDRGAWGAVAVVVGYLAKSAGLM